MSLTLNQRSWDDARRPDDVNEAKRERMCQGGAVVDIVAALDRAPGFVRRLGYRVANGQGALGRIADAVRFPVRGATVPPLPTVASTAVRVFIGPANSAGQGHQWARAMERNLPGVSATAMRGIGETPFQPEVDVAPTAAVYQRSALWHEALEQFLGEQTHVLWESGLPLLGRRYGSSVAREVALLGDRGVAGALMFHGSDIRPPAQHAERNEWSPFRVSTGAVRTLEETALRNAALALECGAPVFVSTPDLLEWSPQATWCPVVVDPGHWQNSRPDRAVSSPLVVVHAPSSRWLKGTTAIEPTLRKLEHEGILVYRQVEDASHASMPSVYAEADVMLDQFLLGSYGVAACEAMASGALVMGHIDPATRALVRDRTGTDLPVHEATVDSLERELRRVAAQPELLATAMRSGPTFVESVHDGRLSAAALEPFLATSA